MTEAFGPSSKVRKATFSEPLVKFEIFDIASSEIALFLESSIAKQALKF